jgi:hypothetical protein
MFGLTSGGSPDLIQTRLDKLFKEDFDRERQPGEVMATDPLFFRQDSTDKGAVTDELFMPPGDFNEHVEEQDYEEATVRGFNRATHSIKNYKRSIPIPEEFFEDDQWNAVGRVVEGFGLRARTSRDKYNMRQSYGDAFSGAVTNASVALVSNSHQNGVGDTVDNLEQGVLNADNLFTIIKSLRLQKAQDGDLGSYHADGMLVPVNLHRTAMEVTKSEQKSGTGNNDLNYYSQVYPGLKVGASPYLDATYNTLNANANTSYFVVSRNHSVTRTTRLALRTKLVPPDTDSKGRYFYRARFREETHPLTYEGVVGSNGTV